jgi:hypothetical protein
MSWHTERVQRSGVTGLVGVAAGADAATRNTVVAATMTAAEYLYSLLRTRMTTTSS